MATRTLQLVVLSLLAFGAVVLIGAMVPSAQDTAGPKAGEGEPSQLEARRGPPGGPVADPGE